MAAKTYSEELVYTSSEDGFLLEGVAIRPPGAELHPVGVIWIHGNAGRFYDYPYVAVGRAMAAAGYLFISANTRGHDIATMLWRGASGQPAPWQGPQAMPTGGGSAWERLEEAPRDLAAWVDLAASLGRQSIVLAGHSSGAQRVVLYQAERQDPRVAGLVLASPDLRGFIPPGELEAAQRLIAEGHELEVTPAQPFAPWYRQSAQTVVDKAAITSHLLQTDEGAPTIAAIRCPMLAFFGTSERGGAATLATIRQNATTARIDSEAIEGADHVYSGHESGVAEVIARWVAHLV
ncbi:MAG TPA: alpha/beta fold hydrolase [Ktedonobacterales bacterium]|jgi:alpha-beta hydrolase superfamily lysophospholipase|nr:alpha/beta fold hydrolase [Ktedonobacterales bacterium]